MSEETVNNQEHSNITTLSTDTLKVWTSKLGVKEEKLNNPPNSDPRNRNKNAWVENKTDTDIANQITNEKPSIFSSNGQANQQQTPTGGHGVKLTSSQNTQSLFSSESTNNQPETPNGQSENIQVQPQNQVNH